MGSRNRDPRPGLEELRGHVFGNLRKALPDKNLAVEAALDACKAEEDAMLAPAARNPYLEVAPLRVEMRNLMKQDLLPLGARHSFFVG